MENKNNINKIKILEGYIKNKNISPRDLMILDNLKLVNFTILNYFKDEAIDYEDLFQQGCIGLIKAVDDYNSNKSKFSIYAIRKIKKSIKSELENNRKIINAPDLSINEIKDLINKLENKSIKER